MTVQLLFTVRLIIHYQFPLYDTVNFVLKCSSHSTKFQSPLDLNGHTHTHTHHLMLCLCICSGVQTGRMAGSQSVTLQPWLVGLTAVVGFLFIVFTILIIHRLLRKSRSAVHTQSHTQQLRQQNSSS